MRFSRLIAEEYGNSLSALLPNIQEAYLQALLSGKRQAKDGTLMTFLLAPLESLRLSDAQGDFAQHYLHLWGEQHPMFEAGFETNKRKRNHVVVRTKRTLLTAHRVQSPSSFPPNAAYRQSNAQLNFLWLPGLQQYNKSNGLAYLFLLHGPSISDSSRLGFLRMAAPNPEGKDYLAYHDIFIHTDFKITTQVEEIQDTAMITLKVGHKKTNEAS
jgi:hypothetical protein